MRAAIYARVSTLDQQPENQLAELRRYVAARGWDAAVEYVDHGVTGSKDPGRRSTGSSRTPGAASSMSVVTWKLDRLGPQPEAPDHAARRAAGARRRVRQPRRRDRRHDAGRQAADAHPRRDRRVRAGADRRARPRRAGAAGGAGQAARPTTPDHQPGRPRQDGGVEHATGGRSTRRLTCRRPSGTGCLKNPSNRTPGLRLKRPLFDAGSAVTVASVTVTANERPECSGGRVIDATTAPASSRRIIGTIAVRAGTGWRAMLAGSGARQPERRRLGRPKSARPAFQPRRFIITPSADGCKRLGGRVTVFAKHPVRGRHRLLARRIDFFGRDERDRREPNRT